MIKTRACRKCGGMYDTVKCKECVRAYYIANKDKIKAYRAANPDIARAARKKYEDADKEKTRERRARYKELNKERIKAGNAKYYAENAALINAKGAAWRRENIERVTERNAQYRAKNREKIKESQEKHFAAHPERIGVAQKEYRERNPEKHSNFVASWAAANRGAVRVIQHNRRVRVRGGGRLSADISDRLLDLQKGKCACCGESLGDDYHLDHIMPIALGGANEDWNIQLLKAKCNRQKSSKNPIYFMQQRGKLL